MLWWQQTHSMWLLGIAAVKINTTGSVVPTGCHGKYNPIKKVYVPSIYVYWKPNKCETERLRSINKVKLTLIFVRVVRNGDCVENRQLCYWQYLQGWYTSIGRCFRYYWKRMRGCIVKRSTIPSKIHLNLLTSLYSIQSFTTSFITGTVGSNPIRKTYVQLFCVVWGVAMVTSTSTAWLLNFNKQDPQIWKTEGPWSHWPVARYRYMSGATTSVHNGMKSWYIKKTCYVC